MISAEQQGNRILVVMRDDGRGIDPIELRAAAVRHRIASAAELERWTTEELLDLIFEPGFSTRASTTDVSGRGVGMDVVKRVVVRLGGAVRVQSEPQRDDDRPRPPAVAGAAARGARRSERRALRAAHGRRAANSRVAPGRLPQLQQGPIVEVEGEAIPLTALGALLQLPDISDKRLHQTVLVAETEAGRFGLLVDAVHEEQELVFKELRGPLRNQRTFAGAALLGNGDIVPILDVRALFELASRAPSAPTAQATPRRAAARAARVLVVEDSLVAGELQKNILIAAGYEADIAHDGAEALELLRLKEWDLVITDVDMPRMDGFELTARLRADERVRDMPVIIVTARDSIDDRRRGFEVGADAYVMKREFDQVQLLDTVRRLIGRGRTESAVTSNQPRHEGREGSCLRTSRRPPDCRVRVLIVDDSVVVREVLKRMLESDPAIRVVGMAADGGEAVELTAQLKPDLVTMDLVMPGMNGMEATERIMAYHPTPVLFFSSYFDREGMYSRLDALAAGALDIMEKPALMPDWRWQTTAGALIQKVKSLSTVPVIAHIHGARRLLAQERSLGSPPAGRQRVGRPSTSWRSAPRRAVPGCWRSCSRRFPPPTLWASSWSSTWPTTSWRACSTG